MASKKMRKKTIKIVSFIVLAVLALFFFLSGKADIPQLEPVKKAVSNIVDEINGQLEVHLSLDDERITTTIESPLLQVHYIDVGQGEAILLRTEEGDLLIDAGETTTGSQLVDYLRKEGVTELSVMILTHPHSDHIGGASAVLNAFPVRQVVLPDIPDALIPSSRSFTSLLEAMDSKGLMITSAEPNSEYTFGSTTLRMLAPLTEPENLNDLSIVLRVDTGDVSFLFTGDAEKEAENQLLSQYTYKDLEADVLSIGHHGSATSTTKDFLRQVSPAIGVISCGMDNTYGHPHKDVMERLQQRNIDIYRTDRDGTIVLETDGDQIAVATEKGDPS